MTLLDFFGLLLTAAITGAAVLTLCLLTTPPTSRGRRFLQWLGGHFLTLLRLEERAHGTTTRIQRISSDRRRPVA